MFDFSGYRFLEHITMHNADLKAVNSARGETVKPESAPAGRIETGAGFIRVEAKLPPASWNVIRLGVN